MIALAPGRRPTRVIQRGGHALVSAMCKHMFAKRGEGQTLAPIRTVHGALDWGEAFHLPTVSLARVTSLQQTREEDRGFRTS